MSLLLIAFSVVVTSLVKRLKNETETCLLDDTIHSVCVLKWGNAHVLNAMLGYTMRPLPNNYLLDTGCFITRNRTWSCDVLSLNHGLDFT